MQIIIKNGKVVATHEDHQDVADKYPGCECILWEWDLPTILPGEELPDDPRTKEQKDGSYKDARRIAYPLIIDQLELIYNDKKNGTNTFVKAIDDIKIMFPKVN